MKTSDFNSPLTSAKLNENMNKMFGVRIKLENYSREQLEDMRNKLRTRVFQQEGSAGINDLLTNETYQKNKAMLDLLNTRIKEMLGENIKQLRDKMVELSEGKKKGDGNLANNAKPYDKITRGDVIAGRLGKDEKGGKVKEGFPTVDDAKARAEKEKTTGKFDKKEVKPGVTQYTRKSSTFTDGGDDSDVKAAKKKSKKDESVKEGKKHPADCDCKECYPMEGKDEGKPGKNFAKIAKSAGKRYGSKEAGERVAGAVRAKLAKQGKLEESNFKHNVRFVNESLAFLINEDEEGKAKAITAAGDIVNDYTSWMQRVGQYQTKTMIVLADQIKGDFGAQEAEAFKAAVGPALAATLEVLTQQREALSNAVAVLAGEATPEAPMGMEPEEPAMDVSAPDEMNPEPVGDEFGAADAAAGAGTTGREMRESKFARKLAESHNIMATLAK